MREAFADSCRLLGRCPRVLVHDNKPIHNDEGLKAAIEPTTQMLPATAARPENKAVVEGEFGKFEQAVGSLHLDDSSLENLKRSALSEAIRAYTAGINHAGRAELDGKSRLQVLREACPDPEQDRAFLEQLQPAMHSPTLASACRANRWPVRSWTRALPASGSKHSTPRGSCAPGSVPVTRPRPSVRGWPSLAPSRPRGACTAPWPIATWSNSSRAARKSSTCRAQEELLRAFAQTERRAWLGELEQDYTLLKSDCENGSTLENDLAFRLSEQTVFGSLPLQRAFWEEKLNTLLKTQRQRIGAVCRHIRRLFEAPWNDRFQLISRLVAWEKQLA